MKQSRLLESNKSEMEVKNNFFKTDGDSFARFSKTEKKTDK